MIRNQQGRDREECHCKLISRVEEKQEKAFLKLYKRQPQLDAGKSWLWHGQLPCFIETQGEADKVGQVWTSHVICSLASYLFRCLRSLSITKKHKLEERKANEDFSFREITTKSSCCLSVVCLGFHRWDAVRYFFLWLANTEKGDCCVCSLNTSCSVWWGHRVRVTALPLCGDSAGFNYPQLCLISLPSWALCPSVLCKCATFTLKSRWDIVMGAHTLSRCRPVHAQMTRDR